MSAEPGLAKAAELFKILGHTSRLWLLRSVGQRPRTVGELVEVTGMAQPLVSQHLRTLRHVGLVTATRSGREVTYSLTDDHVFHVIADAIAHTLEPRAERSEGDGSTDTIDDDTENPDDLEVTP